MILLAAVSWKAIAVVGGVAAYLAFMLIYWKRKKKKAGR